jgi:hypothetical protein
LRQYRKPCAAFHHLADHVEAAEAHANFQLPTGALCLLIHKLLQRACGPEADIVVIQGLGKSDFALSG